MANSRTESMRRWARFCMAMALPVLGTALIDHLWFGERFSAVDALFVGGALLLGIVLFVVGRVCARPL